MNQLLNIIDIAFRTDIGRRREHNEDSISATRTMNWKGKEGPEFCQVMVVADGVGGQNKGEVASDIAVSHIISETIDRWQNAISNGPMDDLKSQYIVKEALTRTNQIVFDQSRNAENSNMASTLVVFVNFSDSRGSWAVVGHAGDSRCYCLNKNSIFQVTRDDSEVQNLIDTKVISKEDGRNHPNKNRITNAVGIFSPSEFKPTVQPVQLDAQGNVLLCTDGLHGVISDNEILNVFKRNNGTQIVNRLVELANERGGPDNISVMVGRLG